MVSASRLSPPPQATAILTGTTASGKTAAALDFARSRPEIEIINADSLLIYRGFSIGTAKPSRKELDEIPHYLIDVRNPDEVYTAGDFVRDCDQILGEIHGRGKRALFVGGTGFYLKALLFGLWDAPKAPAELRARLETRTAPDLYDDLSKKDPAAAERITRGDRYRLIRALETIETTGKTPTQLEAEAALRGSVPSIKLFITDRDGEDLRARIARRTDAMLEAGLLDEVRKLRETYPNARSLESVGYAEVVRFLDERPPEGRKLEPGLPGLRSEIILATTQLAKRQRTWFKGQFGRVPDLKFFRLDADREKLRDELEATYG